MNISSVNGDLIGIKLRQLGAKSIREFNSTMHIVEFDLGDGLLVSYVFNITQGDKYFLQRMRPYAMVHGKFATDQEIVSFISRDISKFRNAKKSRNFKTFIQVSEQSIHLAEAMEELFLNYNVDGENLNAIEKHVAEIAGTIGRLTKTSEQIRLNLDEKDAK